LLDLLEKATHSGWIEVRHYGALRVLDVLSD
jgi:hypothetical protein